MKDKKRKGKKTNSQQGIKFYIIGKAESCFLGHERLTTGDLFLYP